MFILEKKKHGTAFRTIWYAEEPLKQPGINRYRYAEFHPEGHFQTANTFVSDLTEPDEDIVQRISKNGRYEIRRAVKEGVTCEYKVGKEITRKDIEEFVDFFCEFWKSKGIKAQSRKSYIEEIEEYTVREAFAISVAKMGEKTLIYHTYIVGGDFARLYQSASQFRVDESIPPVIVAMANRLLHKEDMLFFKRMGKKFYDWGGAGQGSDVASVTHFKKSFGGTPKEVYDFEEVIGFPAKLVKAVIRLLEKV